MDLRSRSTHPGRLAGAFGLGLVLCLALACSDRGHVVVLTAVPDALVWVDGAQTGAIGAAGFEVDGGRHTIEVTAEGYQPWSTEIEVSSDQPTVLQVELLGLAAFLVVRSNVSGDTVWVDETPLGPSGPQIHEIPSGEYIVRVERPGFTPFVQEVILEPDETVVVQASLVGMGSGPARTNTKIVPVPVPGYAPGPAYPYGYYGAPRPPVGAPPRVRRPPRPRLP